VVAAADISASRKRGAARAVVALGITQMISWGTTYYIPAVFSSSLQRDLGLSATAVFSGIAVMLVTAALLSWPAGRLMDRDGAGRSMPAGSVFLALGLVTLGLAQGLWSYVAAWLLFGVGMSLAMSNAAMSAMTQIAGQGARRSMVVVMLFGGMAATIFWPLTLWLESQFGWRSTCFVYAGLHLLVCAPVHRVFLAQATTPELRRDLSLDESDGLVEPRNRRLAAALITTAVAGNGFVSWGLDLHLIAILQEFGMTAATAVLIAAWKGPATLLARAIDMAAAGRISAVGSAVVAGVLIPAGLALPLVYAAGVPAGVLFITVYSFGTGLMTIVRAALPLALLGSQGYAVTIGRMTFPTQIVFAFSPMAYGLLLERFGLTATLWIALAASLASLGSLLALAKLAKGRNA
jgi:predicted MFS family arabinose efflux permease